MRGNITKRGEHSWRLKFDAGSDVTGSRKTQFVTFRGTKREAQLKLAALIASVGQGSYVEPSKATVAGFVRGRVDVWEAAGDITARTAKRYRQLVENQIAPHLGLKPLQKLTRLDVEGWHAALRVGGLAPRTIGHAHKVLGKALRDAERDDLVARNVCKLQAAPRVSEREMAIVQDVPGFVAKLHGSRFYVPTMVALFTGMRLGEVLALRWSRIDLDAQAAIRCERRSNRPRAVSGSRRRRPRPAGATSRFPMSWSRCCGNIAGSNWNCVCSLVLVACRMTRCCLPGCSTAARSIRTTSHPTGARSPSKSACRRSPFTGCGIPTPASSSPAASIS